jgi:hypothetical protein
VINQKKSEKYYLGLEKKYLKKHNKKRKLDSGEEDINDICPIDWFEMNLETRTNILKEALKRKKGIAETVEFWQYIYDSLKTHA